jgi:5-methylcytosine-specific restriction protein A
MSEQHERQQLEPREITTVADRPLHQCPRCRRRLTRESVCEVCVKQKPMRVRENRPNSRQRGYDAEWERFRAWFVNEHPLCEDCLDEGRTEPTVEVHHIRKLRDYPEGKCDENNCRGLCKPHHSRRTRRGE